MKLKCDNCNKIFTIRYTKEEYFERTKCIFCGSSSWHVGTTDGQKAYYVDIRLEEAKEEANDEVIEKEN